MFLLKCWDILCELAPWLLLGMLLSGLMHALLPPGFIKRKLRGGWGVVKAVMLGIPLPLCSCGVIPAGIGLKNQGASNGASVGFLISTPQTGIDSILVSASFFGWPFAIFKMVTAGITGVIGGWLADAVEPDVHDANSEKDAAEIEIQETLTADAIAIAPEIRAGKKSIFENAVEVWVHGLEIVRSIWVWLAIGILISAVLEVFVPASVFQAVGNWGLFPAMLVMLLISVPLYVCATASVPIAAALVSGGLPAGAALVFLMAGPATNITTIGAIQNRFGWRTLTVYLSTIVLGSMFFAWMFDWLLTAEVVDAAVHQHDHRTWWAVGSAIILLAMTGFFIWEWLKRNLLRSSKIDPVLSGLPEFKISVEGMTCGSCVNKLEKALCKNADVESAEVELNPGLATIIGKAKPEAIYAIIENSGFRVGQNSP